VLAATSRGIVNQLNAEINRSVQQPEVRERFLSIGLVPVGGTPAALGDYLKSEIARWVKVAKEAGIKLEQNARLNASYYTRQITSGRNVR
jgi:tripartite-type tricarboxylate transporter receptor subunit TctC